MVIISEPSSNMLSRHWESYHFLQTPLKKLHFNCRNTFFERIKEVGKTVQIHFSAKTNSEKNCFKLHKFLFVHYKIILLMQISRGINKCPILLLWKNYFCPRQKIWSQAKSFYLLPGKRIENDFLAIEKNLSWLKNDCPSISHANMYFFSLGQ